MNATIVVGGQWGSEGKAKAAVKVVQESLSRGNSTACVRCGGPNAGHTVYVGDKKVILRHLPSGVVEPNCKLYIAAGAIIDIDILMRDIQNLEDLGVDVKGRLMIDRNAAIVDSESLLEEKELGLGERVGSTLTGTGATTAARCMREAKVASSETVLSGFIGDVTEAINTKHAEVIVEGTQGFGLSLWHGPYPFTTSKDTSAMAVASEAGIPWSSIGDVVMVIRTYPIRVGGNSGPMKDETTWEQVRKDSGATDSIEEITSVTKKVRRVGYFDLDMFNRACMVNRPTQIAIHGADYINSNDLGKRKGSDLSMGTMNFIKAIEMNGVPVTMVFTGKHQDDMVYRPRRY